MTDPRQPWYRTPFVWMLIGFPLASVAVVMTMIVLGLRHPDSMVVDDYYQRGKEINLVLARDEAARRHGLAGELAIDPDTGTLRLRLSGQPPAGWPGELSVQFLHATRAGHDRALVLHRTPSGDYHGGMAALPPGRWHVQLSAQDWRLLGELRTPEGRAVRLTVAGQG